MRIQRANKLTIFSNCSGLTFRLALVSDSESLSVSSASSSTSISQSSIFRLLQIPSSNDDSPGAAEAIFLPIASRLNPISFSGEVRCGKTPRHLVVALFEPQELGQGHRSKKLPQLCPHFFVLIKVRAKRLEYTGKFRHHCSAQRGCCFPKGVEQRRVYSIYYSGTLVLPYRRGGKGRAGRLV